MHKLTAIKDFKYEGRKVRVGDPVEMTAKDAEFYKAVGAVMARKRGKK